MASFTLQVRGFGVRVWENGASTKDGPAGCANTREFRPSTTVRSRRG